MPSSHRHELNEITDLIVLTNPQSMLDVGVGFGKYGFLAREYLELWDGRGVYGDWKRRIDGIEVFEDYLNEAHRFIYDTIHVGNASQIIPTLTERYDLVLLIDILEHFDYEEGSRLLDACQQKATNIVVSTPKKLSAQEDAFGNPHEAHKFQWKKEHFSRFGKKVFIPNEFSLICYAGENAPRIKKKLLSVKRRFRKILSLLG